MLSERVIIMVPEQEDIDPMNINEGVTSGADPHLFTLEGKRGIDGLHTDSHNAAELMGARTDGVHLFKQHVLGNDSADEIEHICSLDKLREVLAKEDCELLQPKHNLPTM